MLPVDKIYFKHSVASDCIPKPSPPILEPNVIWVKKIRRYMWHDDDDEEMEIKPDSKPERKPWEVYRSKVRELTEDVAHLLDGIEKRSFKGHHIDHRISIWYGFKNKIPPEEIAALSNLRIIPSKDNMLKGRKCVFN